MEQMLEKMEKLPVNLNFIDPNCTGWMWVYNICYSKNMFILTGKYLLSFITFLSPNWVAVEFAKSPSKYK